MKVKGGDAGLSYVSRQNIPLKKEMTDSQTVVLRPINTDDRRCHAPQHAKFIYTNTITDAADAKPVVALSWN